MSSPPLSTASQLAELLLSLAQALVLRPEAVEVDFREKHSSITFTLSVDPSDRGRIIGKQGKVLQALRLLFLSIATIRERNAFIEIIEFGRKGL